MCVWIYNGPSVMYHDSWEVEIWRLTAKPSNSEAEHVLSHTPESKGQQFPMFFLVGKYWETGAQRLLMLLPFFWWAFHCMGCLLVIILSAAKRTSTILHWSRLNSCAIEQQDVHSIYRLRVLASVGSLIFNGCLGQPALEPVSAFG